MDINPVIEEEVLKISRLYGVSTNKFCEDAIIAMLCSQHLSIEDKLTFSLLISKAINLHNEKANGN